MAQRKTILVDFDEVLHSYTSGWKGADVIPDPPNPGAIEWLRKLIEDGRFDVCVYSSRSKFRADAGIPNAVEVRSGVQAMMDWLVMNGLPRDPDGWSMNRLPKKEVGDLGEFYLGLDSAGVVIDPTFEFRLWFPTQKPPAFLTIDDRCFQFCGRFRFPDPEAIASFKPWKPGDPWFPGQRKPGDRTEQLDVQLAGCGVAAMGGTTEPATRGMYGWSQSYQDVLDLRLKYDDLRKKFEGVEETILRMAHAEGVAGVENRVKRLETRLETLEAIDAQIPPGPPLTKERLLEGVREIRDGVVSLSPTDPDLLEAAARCYNDGGRSFR